MNTFKLTVSSPDGDLFSGSCVKLDVRAAEGDLAVMAGHIPFMTSVVRGSCILHLEDGTRREAFTEGGLLSVDKESVTLISGSFRFG